jgi:glycine C-acetyltransferase
VTGFGYPVVPEGTARVRIQVSAALTQAQLEQAAAALERAAIEQGLLATAPAD